jgi:6-phosphogluconolactonase
MNRKIVFTMICCLGITVTANPLYAAGHRVVGAVYTLSNDAGGNHVLAYDRLAGGRIRFDDAYATGGLGSGDGLGSQGALVLGENGRWLLAVNAGSDELSVFRVRKKGLELTDVVDSGGTHPISVAISRNLVYVLNDGGSLGGMDNVAGFMLDRQGGLHPLAGSSRQLSEAATGPAQVDFSRDGGFLLVTEKATNNIDAFPVQDDGLLGPMVVNSSSGETPFALDFGHRDQVFVSEVFGGAEDAGAVSSYALGEDGILSVIDGSVPNTETAPCWLVVSKGGRYAFTTNTPDDSLSAYAIGFDGSLELVDADGRTGEPGPGTRPLDMDLSDDGRFLYTLDIGTGSIGTFHVVRGGGLKHLGVFPGVPDGAVGLAAR